MPFVTVVVSDADLDAVQAGCAEIEGGQNMFTCPMSSPSGVVYLESGVASDLVYNYLRSIEAAHGLDISDETPGQVMDRLQLTFIE